MEPMPRSPHRTDMNLRVSTAAAIAIALLATACGSQVSPGVSNSSASPSQWAMIQIHSTDNGHTVEAHVGQQIHIELGSATEAGSTYWQFDPVDAATLQVVSEPSASGATPEASASIASIPGLGFGVVTMTVEATAAGITRVTAQRTTCGEAMLCPPERAKFAVEIDVVN